MCNIVWWGWKQSLFTCINIGKLFYLWKEYYLHYFPGIVILIEITDTKIIEDRLQKLAEKYYPTVEEVEKEMNGSARSRVQLFAIRIEHMTGKLVNEK